MEIERDLLTPNEWSRPETPLKAVLGVVMHWTANAAASAKNNRDYFDSRKNGLNGYGSAHYIIDQDGSIVQAIPENEVAYHCGTSKPDPVSHKVYTDEARRRFGEFASTRLSPNLCTIGVELCPLDNIEGNFSDATIKSAVELVADILRRHKLNEANITTHHNVVGWKDCPRLWTNKPALLEAFKYSVGIEMTRGTK